jgi:hypothetical protein
MGGYWFLRRIVRNDAIHLDPPEIYNWRVFALAAAVSDLLELPLKFPSA